MSFQLTNTQVHVIPHTHPTSDIPGLVELIEANAVIVSPTTPANPTAGKLWYNTTKGVFNIYNGSAWILVGPEIYPITKAAYDALPAADKNDGRFYLITDNDGTIIVDWANVENKPYYISATAPDTPAEGNLWYDSTNDILKVYDGNNWNPVNTFIEYQAGQNIQINPTTHEISATDTTYTASDFDIKDLTDSTGLRTTWSGKQDAINDLSTIRSGAAAGATAVQPLDNVSGLTNDAGYITNAVSDLTNYYTKTQTYTKSEVDQMIADFGGFEVVEQLPAVATANTHIIYLLGPIGTGGDRYEEWIVTTSEEEDPDTHETVEVKSWTKIGETSVDLSNYFNTFTDTADSINNGTNHLFVSPSEKSTWNAKQDALTAGSNITIDSNTNTISASVNTKTFPMAVATKVADAQAAIDWVLDGNNALIKLDNRIYLLDKVENGVYYFKAVAYSNNGTNDTMTVTNIEVTVVSDTVTEVHIMGEAHGYLETNRNYATPFVPTQNGHPATKKYVDDSLNAKISAGTASPSNPAEGQLWYDTTNDILKVYDGTDWVVTGKVYTAGTNIDITNDVISADTQFVLVDTLPSISTADENKIYILGPIGTGADRYEEWIKKVSQGQGGGVMSWIKIGETSVDLSGKQDKADSGSTAPGSAPDYVGQMYIDTTHNVVYVAVGTSSSLDWLAVDTNTTYTAGFGIDIDPNNNNEISVDTTDLDGFGLSSNGGTGVLDVDLDALDGFGLSVNGGTGLLDVDIDNLIDTTNGHLDIDPSTRKVSVDMADLTNDLAGFGLSQNPTASSYELKVDTYSIAGEYLSQNASDSKLDVDTSILTSDLAGFGLGTDYNGSTGKYSLKVDVDDFDGFGLTTDSSGANTVLKVDTVDLAGSYLSQNYSNSKLDVDTTSLVSDIAGFGLTTDSSGAAYKLKVNAYDLAGTGLTANNSGGLDIYPMGFVDTSKYLTVDNQDNVGVDIDSLGLALAGSYSGLDYDSSNHNLYVDPMDFVDTSNGYLDVDNSGNIAVDKDDLGTALAGIGLDYNSSTGAIDIDTTVVATQTDIAGINQVPSGGTTGQVLKKTANGYDWGTDENTTYTAGTGLTLSGTEFSADTTVLATKQDIANLGSFTVVQTLPSAASADTKTIYLLGPIGTGADKYEEWIVTEDSQQQKQWTKIGETSVDLSGYATTTALTNGLATKQDTLTSGDGIDIDGSNNISVDVTDIISTGLSEDANNNIIVDYDTVANALAGAGLTYNSGSSEIDVDYDTVGQALAGTGLTYNGGAEEIQIDTTVVATQTDLSGKQDKATSGSTAPSTTPTYVGQQYIDTTNDKMYVATGTSSSSDWMEVGAGGSGSGDMQYSDFNWVTKTGASITLDLNSYIAPSADFTVNAPATIKDGQVYVLRVASGLVPYTMTLGTNITNPYNEDLTLSGNTLSNFSFIATGGNLELQPSIDITGVVTGSYAAAESGTDLSLVTTGEKYIWGNKESKPTSGSGEPAITPSYVGQRYFNTSNSTWYVANGTTSSSDWIEVGNGIGDMLYTDFNWATKTGATITLGINSTITPSANFTVNAPATIKDGQVYILRVTNGATAYTMTLGTGITNPYSTSTTLTANGVDQFVFQAIGGDLELLPDSDVDISGKQDKATTGTAAPSSTPTYVGQSYVNTSTTTPFVATGTSASTDWQGIPILSKQTGAATNVKIWVGTQAAYEALSGSYDSNTLYFTTSSS